MENLTSISKKSFLDRIICSKYYIEEKIGEGACGTVFQGYEIETKEKVAIKVEIKNPNYYGTLELEMYRLFLLEGKGIPKLYHFYSSSNYDILVEELLGNSLSFFFDKCNKNFSLKTVSILAIQILELIKHIHSKYQLHRDIKPENFVTGIKNKGNEHQIYMIDFGISKKYYDKKNERHIKFTTGNRLIGNLKFCSKNAHKGYELSRRDDLENFGYMLIYFLKGGLPWENLDLWNNEGKKMNIAQMKFKLSAKNLCQGLPEEFRILLEYSENLRFEEEPDYDYLIGLFKGLLSKELGLSYEEIIINKKIFDWEKDDKDEKAIMQKKKLRSTENLVHLQMNFDFEKLKEKEKDEESNKSNEEKIETEKIINQNENDKNDNIDFNSLIMDLKEINDNIEDSALISNNNTKSKKKANRNLSAINIRGGKKNIMS